MQLVQLAQPRADLLHCRAALAVLLQAPAVQCRASVEVSACCVVLCCVMSKRVVAQCRDGLAVLGGPGEGLSAPTPPEPLTCPLPLLPPPSVQQTHTTTSFRNSGSAFKPQLAPGSGSKKQVFAVMPSAPGFAIHGDLPENSCLRGVRWRVGGEGARMDV